MQLRKLQQIILDLDTTIGYDEDQHEPELDPIVAGSTDV